MSNNIVQNVINDAVSFAIGIANDNSHGYSQAVRSLYTALATYPKLNSSLHYVFRIIAKN